MEDEMLRPKLPGVLYAVATLALLAPAIATAQPANKRTLFTFSGAVDMPGVALPAGQYEFTIANPDTSRNVIQVRSRDGKKSYGLFLTHSAERATAANDAQIRFMEASAGTPPAVKTWWYPGERTGYEFVYPKEQARRIAQRTKQTVLTTKKETTTAPETANDSDLVRVSPTGSETAFNDAEPGVSESPAPSAQASASSSGRPTQVGTEARARTQLPRTASDTPLIALMGLLLLAAASIVRLVRSQQSL
jgi:LPXTG-motif cell wall-anchored protein